MKSHEFLKAARLQLGISQEELAKKIGVRRYNISKYESGKSNPTWNFVCELLRLQNIYAHDILRIGRHKQNNRRVLRASRRRARMEASVAN